jgi:hypothetical protein
MEMSNEVAAEVVETQQLVAKAKSDVAAVKISNNDDYKAAGEILKMVMAAKKRVEELRTKITGPLNQALKAANDMFRAPADELVSVEGQLKRTMVTYQNELARRQQEEQRAADEAARKQREKLAEQARKAEAAGKPERADVLMQRSEAAVAPVIQREAPKVAGVGTRLVPKFEITNAALLPREYLMPDEVKIRQVVAALKAEAGIPGVRVWMESQIASRSV